MPESLDTSVNKRPEMAKEISTIVAPLLNGSLSEPEQQEAKPIVSRHDRLMAASELPNWKPQPW